MPQPRLEDRYNYMTAPRVCEALGLSSDQLDRRLELRIFPEPTIVTEFGIRLFDRSWLEEARAIMEGKRVR